MAESMADMECRAISIREQRFALANEIRFAQDTLLREKSPIKIARLKTKLALLNTQKEVIYQQSMKTADSIKAQLDSLQEKQLTDSTARRSFSEALKSALKERGCGE